MESNANYQHKFHNLLLQMPVAVAIFRGPDYVVELANDRCLGILIRDKGFIGKPLFESMPEVEDRLKPIFDEVVQTGIPFEANEFEVPLFRKGKTESAYFQIVYEALREDDQTISGIIGAGMEVTELVAARRQTEAREHLYHNMVHTSPSPFSIFKGEDMIIELANDAILKSWGKGKDIIGKSLFEVMPEIVEQGFDKILGSVYKTGEPVHAYETPVTLIREGKPELIHYNFIYQPQHNAAGQIVGIAVIATAASPQTLARKETAESDNRFRTLADGAPIHIFIMEPTAAAAVSYWNKNWLTYTGQTLEEALGNTWESIIHPEDVPAVMAAYVRAFESRQSYFIPAIRVQRHDGVYRWHSVQANPRYLPDGEFLGFIGLSIDIHESKLAQDALKASEAHFRLLADLMPAKISNAKSNGEVIYFNKHWIEFSGYNFEELKDFGYHKMMHPDEIAEFEARLQEAAATETVLEMEMRFLNKNGEYKWHLNLAAPVKDEAGAICMWVGVTTEIQHQKDISEELEKRVWERTGELTAVNKELIISNKELQSFTYVASHDLQEPLRKLQTFGGLILERENDNLSDAGKSMFKRMQEASKRMQTLIQDLLNFSRLGTEESTLESIDIAAMLELVKEELKETIDQKGAVVEVVAGGTVKMIPFQFKQLLHNLIGNALKFSNPAQPPHITIASCRETGAAANKAPLVVGKTYCHIAVTDNGIGFEKAYSDRIFEVFQKLHSKEEYGGTGIGLAIVKKIVANHKGVVTATAELHKGARFDIYIPD